ncbi:MAG: HAD hydrolase-like protein [bacterium]
MLYDMTLTIAVDCDEVLIDSERSFLSFVQEKYGYSWKYEDIRHYFLSHNPEFGISDAEALRLFDEHFQSETSRLAKPILGALSCLQKRKDSGYTLVVVTARNDAAKELTLYQIEKHYPNIFSDIIFAHHYTEKHIPKSDLCKEAGATYLIEDNIDYALDAAENGIYTFLLEKPWNSWRHEESPYIHKVATWDEI